MSPPQSSNTGKVKRKVKSGCRTCKIRKVKCDEGKPACQRCVSTGRVCDGYGIWGGGGNTYHDRIAKSEMSCLVLPRKAPAPLGLIGRDEQSMFEYFLFRSSMKLPGLFSSNFWTSIIFQASSSEAAVLHATLALSSAHTNDMVGFRHTNGIRSIGPTAQEHFTLQQYTKAIEHLQPHFCSKAQASVRVALLACLLFTFMEFMRGRYQTGLSHFRSGLKLLVQYHRDSCSLVDGTLILELPTESVDLGIVQSFGRLHAHTRLLIEDQLGTSLIIASDPLRPGLTFSTPGQARQLIDNLLERTLQLSQQYRKNALTKRSDGAEQLLDQQRCIKQGLASWARSYDATISSSEKASMAMLDSFAYQILRQHHNMTEIMADTCLSPLESSHDAHLDDYVYILRRNIEGIKLASSAVFQAHARIDSNMSHSICDIGGITSQYYLALKCRNHRVRHQAMNLLDMMSHKEGPWNSQLAVCIAREVVRIEEGDFYAGLHLSDDFDPLSMPDEADLSTPVLPDSHRIRHIQVTLPEGGAGNLSIELFHVTEDGTWESFAREFDPTLQKWRDKPSAGSLCTPTRDSV